MREPVKTDILEIRCCVDQGGAFLYNQLWFYCPGCKHAHAFHMDGDANVRPMWSFDGDLDKPSVTPSLRVFTSQPQEDGTLVEKTLCHLVLTKGILNFQSDCPHALRNQNVPMEKFRLFENSAPVE